MIASYICSSIFNWVQEKERYGKIHSIFKNTVNILSEDGKFIPIIVSGKPMSPNSIKLDEKLNFKDFNMEVGEKVTFIKESFISEKISINYGKAILWNRGVELISHIDTYENFETKIKRVKDFIYYNGNKDGIYNLIRFISGDLFPSENNDEVNKSELFIKDRFINFINSFIEYDIKNINNFSKKIIGYGPGLTPSMDDFISGMMIANIYISFFLGFNLEKAYSLNGKIVKDIENMTTLVSEEMLKIASIGEANEDIRNLMKKLMGTSTEEELKELLAKVISFGHSSGTDILCGIYIGSFMLMEKNK